MSEKNIYAQILDAIAEGESVSMNTTIKGESGRISEGLSRTLEIVAQNRAEEGLSVVKPETVKNGGDFEISEPMLPKERLIVWAAVISRCRYVSLHRNAVLKFTWRTTDPPLPTLRDFRGRRACSAILLKTASSS